MMMMMILILCERCLPFQVRLYDTALQRRPAISVEFKESPIKAVAADPNGHDVYIGTGTGDLASFDMRTGKMLACCYMLVPSS